jgi:hypothetical protein
MAAAFADDVPQLSRSRFPLCTSAALAPFSHDHEAIGKSDGRPLLRENLTEPAGRRLQRRRLSAAHRSTAFCSVAGSAGAPSDGRS